jgi:hypothetical protein
MSMRNNPKRPVGWGELNVALNGLVKEGIIVSYSTGAEKGGTLIEVATHSGADQAEVLRRVRENLPSTFSKAQVRTKIA